jgi:glycerophosphoryl diester phosphodiesterase
MLVHDRRAEWRALAARVGAVAVHTWWGFVTADLARDVLAAGYALRAYTVNDVAETRRLFALGVAGVFSDVPGWVATA